MIGRITYEAIEDAAADNIRYLELRFTPVALSQAEGFPMHEVMDWVVEGARMGERDLGVVVRLIASVNRHESIEEAVCLLEGGKSARSILNRVYYGMFYSVLALLIFEDYSSSKHTGVIAYFNLHFIKGGIFPDDPGRFFNRSFELRQRCDYREYMEISVEQVLPFIDKAMEFIDIVKEIINGKRKKV